MRALNVGKIYKNYSTFKGQKNMQAILNRS